MYKDLYVRESQFISLSVIYLVMKKLGSLNKNPSRSILIIDIVKCLAVSRPFLLVVVVVVVVFLIFIWTLFLEKSMLTFVHL